MRLSRVPTAAAWAPWQDGDRDWLIERDELAARWLFDRAQVEQARIVVQGTSHAHDYRENDGPLGRLARAGKVATYRSPVGSGATYVHHASIRLLATAMRTANGHSIAATELPTFPIAGWAMAVGAIDLSSGDVTEDVRSSQEMEMLESFASQLYNGWSHKQVGRRASAHYLPLLAKSGMSYSVFVGSLIALDPAHLDSNTDIDAMHKSLPAEWLAERETLLRSWR